MKRRLLVVSEKLWPEGGGAELATYLIIKMLTQHFTVSVFTGTEFSRIDSAQVVYIPWLKANSKLELWLKIAKNIGIIERSIRKHDIIYIPRASFPIVPIAKKFNKKVIVHLHDYIPISYNALIPYCRKTGFRLKASTIELEMLQHKNFVRAISAGFLSVPTTAFCKLWLNSADKIICVSKRQREIIESAAPELTNKLKVVYNPLPNLSIREKKLLEDPTFLYLGGDSYIKGFHMFLKSSQIFLRRKKSGIKFLLAGNFRYKEKQFIEKLNRRFNNAYSLLGLLKHEEVLKFHSISHALLFPSICEEPLPYVVMEAMIMGTIPIASMVGGVPEIVKGTYAERMMFTPGDIKELVDRMEVITSLSKEELISIGTELRNISLERFDNRAIKREIAKIFEI
jgi:glycosyltransferase involved in cell wall biosynthesis